MSLEESFHRPGAVCQEPVPDDQDGPLDLVFQTPQKMDDLGGGDVGGRMHGKVKTYSLPERGHGQGRDDGDFFVGSRALVKDRRFPAQGPSSPD